MSQVHEENKESKQFECMVKLAIGITLDKTFTVFLHYAMLLCSCNPVYTFLGVLLRSMTMNIKHKHKIKSFIFRYYCRSATFCP